EQDGADFVATAEDVHPDGVGTTGQGGGDGADPVGPAPDAQGQRNQVREPHGVAHSCGPQRSVVEQRCRTTHHGALRDAEDAADRAPRGTRGGQHRGGDLAVRVIQPMAYFLHIARSYVLYSRLTALFLAQMDAPG